MTTVKTTINIDDKLWRDFSISVIEERGYRKKNDVIEELLQEYVDRMRRKENE